MFLLYFMIFNEIVDVGHNKTCAASGFSYIFVVGPNGQQKNEDS